MRIDAHQHFWRYSAAEYPWIGPGMERLARDYLPADLAPLLEAGGIAGCVAVQARQSLEETRWLLELADGHGFERWGNFPHERQRFLDLLDLTGARGVILLSGDRHIGALYRDSTGLARPLVELTASPGTRPFTANREPGPNRLGEVYGRENFGTVDIDWTARQVLLSVRGMDGEAARRLTLGFEELGVPR